MCLIHTDRFFFFFLLLITVFLWRSDRWPPGWQSPTDWLTIKPPHWCFVTDILSHSDEIKAKTAYHSWEICSFPWGRFARGRHASGVSSHKTWSKDQVGCMIDGRSFLAHAPSFKVCVWSVLVIIGRLEDKWSSLLMDGGQLHDEPPSPPLPPPPLFFF